MRRTITTILAALVLATAAGVAGAATAVHWPASCTKMACVNEHLNDVHALAQRADTRALTPGPQGPQGIQGPQGDEGAAGPIGHIVMHTVPDTFDVVTDENGNGTTSIKTTLCGTGGGLATGGGITEMTAPATQQSFVTPLAPGVSTTDWPTNGAATGWSFSVTITGGAPNTTFHFKDWAACEESQ